MIKMPRYATIVPETITMRKLKQFHQIIVERLGQDACDTMRCTAWQIEAYLEEHGKFNDSEWMRTIQHTLEKIVQHRDKSQWTVERAKVDLRGRTQGVNQFAPPEVAEAPRIPRRISKSINDRILEASGKDPEPVKKEPPKAKKMAKSKRRTIPRTIAQHKTYRAKLAKRSKLSMEAINNKLEMPPSPRGISDEDC